MGRHLCLHRDNEPLQGWLSRLSRETFAVLVNCPVDSPAGAVQNVTVVPAAFHRTVPCLQDLTVSTYSTVYSP